MTTFIRTIFEPQTVYIKNTEFAIFDNLIIGNLYTLTFQSSLGGPVGTSASTPYVKIKEGNNTLHEFEYIKMGGGTKILQTINIVSTGEPLTVFFDFAKTTDDGGFIVSEAITDLLGHDVDVKTNRGNTMTDKTYPDLTIDNIEVSTISGTSGNDGGLNNIVYNLNYNGSKKGTLAFLPNLTGLGFAITSTPDNTAINGGMDSASMVTSLNMLIQQNGQFTIEFTGSPIVTMTFV